MKAIVIIDWLSVCIYLKIKTKQKGKVYKSMHHSACWDNQVNQLIQQTIYIFRPEFLFPFVTKGSRPNLPRAGNDYKIGA